MKNDLNNIKTPDPEKFWTEAEKMLDKHFQRKRKATWMGISMISVAGLFFALYILNTHEVKMPVSNQGANTIETSSIALDKKDNSINKTSSNKVNNPTSSSETKSIVKIQNREKQNNRQEENPYTINQAKREPKSHALTNRKSTIKENNFSATPTLESTMNTSGSTAVENSLDTRQNNKRENSDAGTLITVKKADVIEERGALKILSLSKREFLKSEKNIPELSALPPYYQEDYVRHSPTGAFAFSFYTGLHSITANLSSTKNSEYLQRRKAEEKTIIAPVLGINFSRTKQNISTSIGFEYSYYGEKTAYGPYSSQMQYTQSGEWQPYTYTIIDVDTALTNGLQWFLETRVTVSDSTYAITTDSMRVNVFDPSFKDRNSVNKFQYLEIPLIFKYAYPMKRLIIGLYAGVSPALLISQNGNYLKKDESGVESIAETKPLKSFFLNGRAGLELSYLLHPDFSITLSPQYKFNLGSISHSELDIKQKYTTAGINVGLVYNLH